MPIKGLSFSPARAVLVLAFTGAMATAASATCSNTPLNFCDGCKLSQDWFTAPGEVCTVRTYFANGVISLRVTRKPRQGLALVSSNSYGFRANPNFKGTDAFGIEIRFRDRVGKPQTTQIAVNVKPSR